MIYVLKPGIMLLIIGVALIDLQGAGKYGFLIVIGLLFSLAGDLFLMLPSDRFLEGLISFFIPRVIYAAAFMAEWSQKLDDLNVLIWLMLALLALLFFRLLLNGVKEKGGRAMVVAVF